MSEEFYIGYLKNAPGKVSQFIMGVVVAILLILMGVAWLLAYGQKGFIASTYEYYRETEISGVLIKNPFPAIQVHLANSNEGELLVQTIPIVQFGKIGGSALGNHLEGAWITARGFLIYYDGKALMEISDPGNIAKTTGKAQNRASIVNPRYSSREATFVGEILDAKCFFGVMKPGHGKPHRSCAIRCISGGIPAVLHTTGADGLPSYKIVLTTSENRKQLLQFVGETVTVSGTEGKFYDWQLLKLSAVEPLVQAENQLSATLTLCH